MSDTLNEAIDGVCEKLIEQRDRIEKLEAALREIEPLVLPNGRVKQIIRRALVGKSP